MTGGVGQARLGGAVRHQEADALTQTCTDDEQKAALVDLWLAGASLRMWRGSG